MIDAAQNAGVVFDPMDETVPDFALNSDLTLYVKKRL